MRRVFLPTLVFVLAGMPAASGAEAADQTLMARVHQTTASIYDDLKSFVCDEHIERFRTALDGSHPKPIDVISAALSFENGTEQYSNVYQDSTHRESMSAISGAWSEGEFGSLLRQTGELLNAEMVTFTGTPDEDGSTLTTYAFDTGDAESPWQLVVDAREYRVAFRTEISVSNITGQIVRIARRTQGLLPEVGISEIDWSVTLSPTRLQGTDWILPVSAEYVVTYAQKKRREWNRMTFDHYRRYGAEVALRFDGQ